MLKKIACLVFLDPQFKQWVYRYVSNFFFFKYSQKSHLNMLKIVWVRADFEEYVMKQ